MNLFNLTKKFHEHSDGIIAKQQKAYMKPKKEIFKGYTILMFVKIHCLHKLKIRLYTKLVSNLIDFSLFLNCVSLKKPKNTSL